MELACNGLSQCTSFITISFVMTDTNINIQKPLLSSFIIALFIILQQISLTDNYISSLRCGVSIWLKVNELI